MQVRVVYFEGCPNHKPAVDLVRSVADEVGVPIEIESVLVETPEQARVERMLGSPTIQVDGVDIDPTARSRDDFAFSCRVFDGHAGLPPRAMIAAALTGEAYQACSGPSEGGCC